MAHLSWLRRGLWRHKLFLIFTVGFIYWLSTVESGIGISWTFASALIGAGLVSHSYWPCKSGLAVCRTELMSMTGSDSETIVDCVIRYSAQGGTREFLRHRTTSGCTRRRRRFV
jgi:hypothetical protein